MALRVVCGRQDGLRFGEQLHVRFQSKRRASGVPLPFRDGR